MITRLVKVVTAIDGKPRDEHLDLRPCIFIFIINAQQGFYAIITFT